MKGQVTGPTENDIEQQNLLINAKKEIILENLDAAIELLEELLGKYENPAAAYELSRIYAKKDNLLQAESYAQRAYESEKNNTWFMEHYIYVLSENGNDLKAAEILAGYLKNIPGNKEYYTMASTAYLNASKSKEALAILEDYEKFSGVSEEISQRKFEIYDADGREKNALRELQKLSEAFPNETRYLHNIAGYLRKMGKEQDANKIMAQILKIDPNDEAALLFVSSNSVNKDANYLRSLVPVIKDHRISLDKKILELIPYLEDFALNGDEDLGRSLLDVSKIMDEEYPANPKVKSILGDIYFYRKEWILASESYEASLKYEKAVWAVWDQLLTTLRMLGDFEKLISLSGEAIEVYPNQARAFLYYSLGHLENNHLEEAEMAAFEAGMIGAGNTEIEKELNYLKSRIAFIKKDYTSAFSLIKVALKSEENNPFYLEHLGDIYQAQGDLNSAKESWNTALKYGGDSTRLEMKINGKTSPNNQQ